MPEILGEAAVNVDEQPNPDNENELEQNHVARLDQNNVGALDEIIVINDDNEELNPVNRNGLEENNVHVPNVNDILAADEQPRHVDEDVPDGHVPNVGIADDEQPIGANENVADGKIIKYIMF